MTSEAILTFLRTAHSRWWFRHGVLVVAVALLAHAAGKVPVLRRFESASFDRRLASRPPIATVAPVVIFEIDDKSLSDYGRWPWPRSRMAAVVRKLSAAKARQILLDVEFSEASVPPLAGTSCESATALEHDRALAQAAADAGNVYGMAHAVDETVWGHLKVDGSISQILDILKSSGVERIEQLPPALQRLPRAQWLLEEARLTRLLTQQVELDSDELSRRLKLPLERVHESIETLRAKVLRKAMTESVAATPSASAAEHVQTVLTRLGVKRPEALRMRLMLEEAAATAERAALERSEPLERDPECTAEPPAGEQLVAPILPLVQNLRRVVASNAPRDADGIARRVPLLWIVGGRVVPQAGFALALDVLKATTGTLRLEKGPAITAQLQDGRKLVVPVDERCQMLINWVGDWSAFEHKSIAGILDAIGLERAYLECLQALDPTGLSEQLAADAAMTHLAWKWPPREAPGDEKEASPRERARGLGLAAPASRLGWPTAIEDSAALALPPPRASALENQILAAEAELLEASKMALARMRQLVEEHKNDTGPEALANQAKRRERLQKMQSLLETAARLRLDLMRRCEEIEAIVKDKSCLVGSSATALADMLAMPYQQGYPGVGLQANVMDTILSGRYLARTGEQQELAITLGSTFVGSWMFALASLEASLLLAIAVLSSQLFLSFAMLTKYGLWVPVVEPALALILISLLLTASRYFVESRLRSDAERMFGYYLSSEVIQQLRADPSRLRRGGEDVEITAFFTDLAGFSTAAEAMTPQDVVELVNDYLGECTEILMEYQGTLERYEGDAIRAMFGAPIKHSDHAARACFAALDMQRVVLSIGERYKSKGLPSLAMRIGLNSGRAVVGNIGARNRFNFTMMGDSVNLAARLEGANKVFGTRAIIGGTTYARAADAIDARELDAIRVVGRSTVVRVYELLARKGQTPPDVKRSCDLYAQALELYRAKEWTKAIEILEGALSERPDAPSKQLLERCRTLLEHPPIGVWDGVLELKSK